MFQPCTKILTKMSVSSPFVRGNAATDFESGLMVRLFCSSGRIARIRRETLDFASQNWHGPDQSGAANIYSRKTLVTRDVRGLFRTS